MIVVTKRTSIGIDESTLKFYKCKCPGCNSEFVFSSIDTTKERRIDGKEYLSCPVCSKYIFIKPDIFRAKSLEEISEEEYKKVIPQKEN